MKSHSPSIFNRTSEQSTRRLFLPCSFPRRSILPPRAACRAQPPGTRTMTAPKTDSSPFSSTPYLYRPAFLTGYSCEASSWNTGTKRTEPALRLLGDTPIRRIRGRMWRIVEGDMAYYRRVVNAALYRLVRGILNPARWRLGCRRGCNGPRRRCREYEKVFLGVAVGLSLATFHTFPLLGGMGGSGLDGWNTKRMLDNQRADMRRRCDGRTLDLRSCLSDAQQRSQGVVCNRAATSKYNESMQAVPIYQRRPLLVYDIE
ncbi:hypothetical protein DFP72DRAFT_542945 [Ephemerocybe angulata]|uniref:Uncharacterized protein n=1 Tax=Ephemerocybe angulata TaxID=980116 RepID=A0A8H6HPH8_9AGAR|nr:hypothetical protein DFP72DRAFT_542945 [Tulosesus angulatus]